MLDRFSLELVEAVFDSLGDIVYCVKNRESQYESVNQAFLERVNVADKSEMLGRTARDFFPAPLAEVYDQQDQVVFGEARSIQDQLERITHHDGSMGWFLASKYPVTDERGDVTGLLGISQDLHTPSDSDLELANLRSVVDYIQNNLDQSLRTEALAARIDLSPDQLDRRMKRVFRLTTHKFITKCRLEEATRRLVSSDEPLAAIATACGFSDQSAFTRQFRAAENIPPLTYRKKHSRSTD